MIMEPIKLGKLGMKCLPPVGGVLYPVLILDCKYLIASSIDGDAEPFTDGAIVACHKGKAAVVRVPDWTIVLQVWKK